MRQLTPGRVVLILFFVALFAAVAQVQSGFGSGGGAASGTGGSRAVSSSAVAAIWSHDDPDHTPVLELLVLMRGAPGWYASSGPGTNGYTTSYNNNRSTNHAFATTGSLTVAVDSDSSVANKKLTVTSSLTTVFDQQFSPESLNVVLVDRADTNAPSVSTERIDPRLPGEGDALTRAIRSTPDLFNFIQCETTPPRVPPGSPRPTVTQVMAISFCRQLR